MSGTSGTKAPVEAGEPQEIRAFVLSDEKCSRVTLYWRPLGEGQFREVPATCRARQAYRVSLPARPRGAVEYYLQAVLADGEKVLWPATAPGMDQTAVVW